jgi:hypothetical protein
MLRLLGRSIGTIVFQYYWSSTLIVEAFVVFINNLG